MGSVNTVGYKYTYANLQNRLWWSSVEKSCTSFLNTVMILLYNHDGYAYSLDIIKIANKILPTICTPIMFTNHFLYFYIL